MYHLPFTFLGKLVSYGLFLYTIFTGKFNVNYFNSWKRIESLGNQLMLIILK